MPPQVPIRHSPWSSPCCLHKPHIGISVLLMQRMAETGRTLTLRPPTAPRVPIANPRSGGCMTWEVGSHRPCWEQAARNLAPASFSLLSRDRPFWGWGTPENEVIFQTHPWVVKRGRRNVRANIFYLEIVVWAGRRAKVPLLICVSKRLI